MSTKLSEALQHIADGMDRPHDVPQYLVKRARALEARIAELEQQAQYDAIGRSTLEGQVHCAEVLCGQAERNQAAATARAEAAEAERKEFMLETQRKEIECNELASEVARLRGLVEQFELPEDVYEENRALRAKLAKVRAYATAATPYSDACCGVIRILDGEGSDEA